MFSPDSNRIQGDKIGDWPHWSRVFTIPIPVQQVHPVESAKIPRVKSLVNGIAEAQRDLLTCLSHLRVCLVGTSVMQVTATDADDPTYGNSARLVYSILQGQPYFSVEPQTGEWPESADIHTQIKCRTAASHRKTKSTPKTNAS